MGSVVLWIAGERPPADEGGVGRVWVCSAGEMSRTAHLFASARADFVVMEEILGEVIESFPSPEDQRVLRWRLDQFMELGFDLPAGAMLADSRVDLEEARRLVARGCPVEVAVRILL